MASHSYSFNSPPTDPIATARDALNGLAVGDAFEPSSSSPTTSPLCVTSNCLKRPGRGPTTRRWPAPSTDSSCDEAR